MNKTASAANDADANAFLDQPARESNIRAIADYVKSGIISPEEQGRLGIELEHIIVHDDLSPVSYSEPHGIAWTLEQLEADFPQTTFDADGDLLGVARPGEAVTIEPAAQLELSAGPFATLDAAKTSFDAFENHVRSIVGPVGQRVLTIGYHPTATAQSLELIPKRRYKFMNLYLGAKGPFGPAMMRGSASTQVSIDYTSVEDCLKKLRVAYALVPLFSLMCDNAPQFEAEKRTHQLVRTEIWQHCDPDRCGLIPRVMEPGFSLEDYAAFVLDMPAILMPCKKEQWCYSERTFGEIYADRTMTTSDVEHALSMVFTDIRLKTYLEIRPADAMPIPYAIAYAALIKALFYNTDNLNAAAALFTDVSGSDIEAAKNELMAQGYDATVYGRPVAQLCDEIINLATAASDDSDRAYLEPLVELVAARTTLANEAESRGIVEVDG